jgi:hypothetical protein
MERAADEVQRRSWTPALADPIARTDDTAGEQPHGKRRAVYPIRYVTD